MNSDPSAWQDRLAIVEGDLTQFTADGLVNAASHSLLGNAGLSGAMFAAAGPGLRAACAALGECPAGEARITKAYGLPARHVIHAVSPVWYDGDVGQDEVLARCYRSCLALAEDHGHRTVAFPSLATGAHGFPAERASRVALREIASFLSRNATVEKITIVCSDPTIYRYYLAALDELTQGELPR